MTNKTTINELEDKVKRLRVMEQRAYELSAAGKLSAAGILFAILFMSLTVIARPFVWLRGKLNGN